MAKIQRGRWSTKVNVLKQDRVIYNNEGFDVGFHDGRYKLGKYLVDGFSQDFYRNYEEGYKVGFNEYDSNGFEKGLDDYFSSNENNKAQRSPNIRNKNSGCLGLIMFLGIFGGIVDVISGFF